MFKKPDILMPHLSKREKSLLLILLLVLLIFVNYRYLLGPQIESYRTVKSELNKFRAQAAQKENINDLMQSENDAVEAASRRIEKAREKFSVNMQDGSALFLLGQWAVKDNVIITSYQPGLVANKGAHLELPLEIGLRGNYQNILTLVKQVEEMANLAEIRFLDIKSYKPPASKDAGIPAGTPDQSLLLQQDGTVVADLNLVMYSDITPRGQLVLEEMTRWSVGKGNAFLSTGFNMSLLNKKEAIPVPAPAQQQRDVSQKN